jgi:hypothetical protein
MPLGTPFRVLNFHVLGLFAGAHDPSGWGKKRPPVVRAASTDRINLVDYGAYVIVRTPATLLIVMVVPCEKPVGYDSWATEFSAFTYDVGPRRSEMTT